MRIIISDRNRKETSLKSELHSAQILLSSTVGHYKSKTEEVIILKKDFKQKEDKFLEEFLDIKRLKDKIEDRLYKQDQSVQTVHMLCKPKSFYDEKNKVAIGYKNPLCLTRAKQAQSALYNGHVLVTTNHTPTVIHDSEDTREIAEITRKRMLLKMQSPLYLEADMSKVHNKSKHISKLEREYLNLQLKYQHLQESFDNKNSHTSQEAPDFNSFFKIKNLEHQIQEKDNVIRDLKVLVANVNDRSCEPYNAKDVTALIEQNDGVRIELEKVKQHYKELYDSIKITRTHTSEKTSTLLNEIESLKAQLRSKESCFTSDSVEPKVLAPGMYAIDVKPIPHPLKNNRSAHLNSISAILRRVKNQFREIVMKARVVKPWIMHKHNFACRDINGADILKGSRSTNLYTISIDEIMKSSLICLLSKASKSKSWLWHRRLNHLNFGTINDLARKDLVRGVYQLKLKRATSQPSTWEKARSSPHKTKSENTNKEVLQTLSHGSVGLNKTVRFIRTDNGTEFVNQVMSEYYEGVGIFHQKSILRTPQQNGVVERRNRTLVEAARTMMIFSKAPMFL
ncbi:retrovirus-related pol polyprotein from transposon TNT 1-94 [Tanacetum coccineum]